MKYINDYWRIKEQDKKDARELKKREKRSRGEDIAFYDINSVVAIDKETLNYIIRDEMMVSLLAELGIDAFNDWYLETIGGKKPFYLLNPKPKMKGLSKKLYLEDVKRELLEEDK